MTRQPLSIAAIEAFKVPPRWIMVRVTTADGTTGWGEAVFPKRAAAVIGAIDDLAHNVLGRDARRIEDLWQRMSKGGFYRGGPVLGAAMAGIETALWDIKGKALGVPIYELLGGAVRDRIRTYAWIGGDKPTDVVDHARQRVSQGFTAVKMNATEVTDHLDRHGVIDDAVARVTALRDAFGETLDIAVDLHGRVPRMVTRILLAELEPYRLMWAEEPGTPGAAQLREAVRGNVVPIALGERLHSRRDVKPVLEDGIVDILQPDISLTGLFELEKIAWMAEPYDVTIAPHCPNGPVSLAASLQVGFCTSNVIIQEQSAQIHYHAGYAGLPTADIHDYLRDPAPLQTPEGYFAIGNGPGLGIDLDEDKIVAASADWRMPDSDWEHADGRFAEW